MAFHRNCWLVVLFINEFTFNKFSKTDFKLKVALVKQ